MLFCTDGGRGLREDLFSPPPSPQKKKKFHVGTGLSKTGPANCRAFFSSRRSEWCSVKPSSIAKHTVYVRFAISHGLFLARHTHQTFVEEFVSFWTVGGGEGVICCRKSFETPDETFCCRRQAQTALRHVFVLFVCCVFRVTGTVPVRWSRLFLRRWVR